MRSDLGDCTTTEPPSLLGTQTTILPTAQTPPTLLASQATVMFPTSPSRNLATRDSASTSCLAAKLSNSRQRVAPRERQNDDTDGFIIPTKLSAPPSVPWSRDDSAARARASQQTSVLRFPLAPDTHRLGAAPPYNPSASNSPPPQNGRPLMWSPPLGSAAHPQSFRMTPSRQQSPRQDQQSPFRHVAPTTALPQWPAMGRSLPESRHTSSQPLFGGQSQPAPSSWHWQPFGNQSQAVPIVAPAAS